MVDRPQLKTATHDAFDDDPFAELTRIMGFDPRQPVAPAKPAPRVVAAPQPVIAAPELDPGPFVDDFSLDLERELMGEFGAEMDAAPALRAVEPLPAAAGWPSQAQAHHAVEDRSFPAHRHDHAEGRHYPAEPVSRFEQVAYEAPYEPNAAEPAPQYPTAAQQYDSTDEGRYEQRYQPAAEPVDSYPATAYRHEPVEEHYESAGARTEYAAPVAEARYQHAETAEVYEYEEDGYQDDLDAYGAESAEFYSVDEAPRAYAEEQPYHEPAADAAYARHGEIQPELPPVSAYEHQDARRYDAGQPDTRYAAEPAYRGEAHRAEAPSYYAEDEADVEAAVAASLEEEFALDPDWSDLGEHVAEAPQTEPVAHATALADEVPADFDTAMAEVDMDFRAVEAQRSASVPEPQAMAPAAAPDLEDELNALLGNMRAGAATQAAHAPVREQAAPMRAVAYAGRSPAVDVAGTFAASRAASDDGENPFNAIFSDPAEPKTAPQASRAAPMAADLPDPTAAEIESDPVNSLAAMAARLRAANRGAYWPTQQQMPASERAAARAAAGPSEEEGAAFVPEIETVDVEEAPVALADDLDLPEIRFDEEAKASSAAYDDLEAGFADLLGDGDKSADYGRAQPAGRANQAEPGFAGGGSVDNGAAYGYAAAPMGAELLGRGVAARGTGRQESYAPGQGFYSDTLADSRPLAGDAQPDVDLEYDPALEDDIGLPEYPVHKAAPRRRGLMVAAVVGGVAIVGAIGALALSFGDGGSSGAPVIVRADQAPIKVKPENPGGITVPNQDNKVYDSVAGGGAAVEANQGKLVTTTEEPIDIAPPGDLANDGDLPLNAEAEDQEAMAASEGEDAATLKNEDRVEQGAAGSEAGQSSEVAAVAPRKVRTLVVKPDGSLVTNDEPAPAADEAGEDVAAVDTAEAMEDPVVSVIAPEAETTTGAVTPSEKPASAASTETTQAPAATPDAKPEQVASVEPTAIAAGTWAVQIASQPTAESAQASYKDLSRRYASVLGGREASIVKAEISGKGTFWRVRIPAGSRAEAVNLCNSYKAAGGNCFVSR